MANTETSASPIRAFIKDDIGKTSGNISNGKTTFLTRFGISKTLVVELERASPIAVHGIYAVIRYSAKLEVLEVFPNFTCNTMLKRKV